MTSGTTGRVPIERPVGGLRYHDDCDDEFASFQSISRLFQATYFFRRKQTLLVLKFLGAFYRSLKSEIRHFHGVVNVQWWRQRNEQKSVLRMQSCRRDYSLNLLVFWRFCCRHRHRILNSLLKIADETPDGHKIYTNNFKKRFFFNKRGCLNHVVTWLSQWRNVTHVQ